MTTISYVVLRELVGKPRQGFTRARQDTGQRPHNVAFTALFSDTLLVKVRTRDSGLRSQRQKHSDSHYAFSMR